MFSTGFQSQIQIQTVVALYCCLPSPGSLAPFLTVTFKNWLSRKILAPTGPTSGGMHPKTLTLQPGFYGGWYIVIESSGHRITAEMPISPSFPQLTACLRDSLASVLPSLLLLAAYVIISHLCPSHSWVSEIPGRKQMVHSTGYFEKNLQRYEQGIKKPQEVVPWPLGLLETGILLHAVLCSAEDAIARRLQEPPPSV